MYLFPICLLATDSEAIAETVSASSASRWRASLSEQPSVEAERWRERQYLPTRRGKNQDNDINSCCTHYGTGRSTLKDFFYGTLTFFF